MADYYGLTGAPLPTTLHGADGEYSVRTLSDRERLAIEDYFSTKDVKVALNSDTTAVIVPEGQTANATMEDFAVLAEFALGVLTVSGFQSITIVATLNASTAARPYGAPTRKRRSRRHLPRRSLGQQQARGCAISSRPASRPKIGCTSPQTDSCATRE
jgi:hypothetical protein